MSWTPLREPREGLKVRVTWRTGKLSIGELVHVEGPDAFDIRFLNGGFYRFTSESWDIASIEQWEGALRLTRRGRLVRSALTLLSAVAFVAFIAWVPPGWWL